MITEGSEHGTIEEEEKRNHWKGISPKDRNITSR